MFSSQYIVTSSHHHTSNVMYLAGVHVGCMVKGVGTEKQRDCECLCGVKCSKLVTRKKAVGFEREIKLNAECGP